MTRKPSTLLLVLSLGLLSLTWAVTSTAAPYSFDQTLGGWTITGTITIDDGIFVNQAAVDALNASTYSITLTPSARPDLSFTLTQDNSTWVLDAHDNEFHTDRFTITVVANGNTLEFQESIYIPGGSGGCFICDWTFTVLSQAGELQGGLFGFWVHYEPAEFGWPDFLREASVFGTGGATFVETIDAEPENLGMPPVLVEYAYSFPVLSPDPVAQLEDLLAEVQAITDDPALSQSLEVAIALLTDDNPKNDVAACGQLEAFLHQVAAMQKSGKLTAEEAADLTQAAEAIKTDLSC